MRTLIFLITALFFSVTAASAQVGPSSWDTEVFTCKQSSVSISTAPEASEDGESARILIHSAHGEHFFIETYAQNGRRADDLMQIEVLLDGDWKTFSDLTSGFAKSMKAEAFVIHDGVTDEDVKDCERGLKAME